MKKISILLFLGLSIAWTACDTPKEKEKKSSTSPDTSFEDQLLDKAFVRKDYATAFVAINTILLKDSTRTGLKDTLFDLYYQQQNIYGLADLGQEILKTDPNDEVILEGTAIAMEALGKIPESIMLQERLFAISGDPRLKLTIANAYASMGDIQKAKDNVNWILNSDNPALDTMTIEQQTLDNSGRSQKVKIKANAHYMMGIIHYRENKKNQAVAEAEKALQISPYFDMAAELIKEVKYPSKRRR